MRIGSKAVVAFAAAAMLLGGGSAVAIAAAEAIPDLPVVAGNDDAITGNEWTTPQDVNKGQVPSRSTVLPYATVDDAKANNTLKKAEDSSNDTSTVRLLNGKWLFKYASKPANAPDLAGVDTMEKAKALTSEIADYNMPVPSSWQTANKYAGAVTPDYPIYNNQDYFWQTPDNPDYENVEGAVEAASNPKSNQIKDSSKAPSEWNPVGMYFRTVNLSKDDLTNNRVIINFQGVQQGFYLYINGQVVGYNEDSFTPSEYDITKYLHEGENLIGAKVYRWTTGGWTENQDMTNFSGIFRDVFMTIQPDVSLFDYALDTTFQNGDYTNATLDLAVDVANATDKEAKRTVRATVFDASGKQFGETMSTDVTVPAKAADAKQATTATVELSATFKNPKLWSAETPNLYTIVFELQENGKTVNAFGKRFGFKSFVMRGQGGSGTSEITINGKNVELYGVASHENSPKGGQYVPYETIVTDIKNAKQLNMNSIRTSHYPQSVHMMELCDEYGIYVMDEFNMETHNGRNSADNDKFAINPDLDGRDFAGNDSRYTNTFIDRATSLIMRDRNNASTSFYSLGNEAGTGPNFDTMIDVIKNLDNEKPIHYQGDNGNARVDIKGSMYPAAGKYRSDSRQPEIAMEYEHSMGNSGGDLDAYINEFETNWRYQGGYLWDYIDKGAASLIPGKDGSKVSDDPTAYANETDPVNRSEKDLLYDGYDSHHSWPQESKDGNIGSNGIINPDRSWQPQAYEVKKQYQGLKFTQTDAQAKAGKVTMKNLNRFLNANHYQIEWTLLKNGEATDIKGVLTDDEANLAPSDTYNADVQWSEKELMLPYLDKIKNPEDGAEYQLLIEYKLKSDEVWAEAGYTVGSEQFEVADVRGADIAQDTNTLGALTTDDGDAAATITGTTADGKAFIIAFNKQTGTMSQYTVDGKDLIVRDNGPIGSFFRPETDSNPGVKGLSTLNTPGKITNKEAYNDWAKQGEDMKDVRVSVVKVSENTTIVLVEASLQNDSAYATTYTIYGDGTVKVTAKLDPSAQAPAELGEYGMLMQLPAEFENLTWYGRGPIENYWNRKSGYNIGVYSSTVTDQYYPYGRICETGNKTDTRWLALTNNDGVGLMATMDYGEGYSGSPLEFVALHYEPEQLSTAQTDGKLFPYEAMRTNNVVLRVLRHQKGVGTETWSTDPKTTLIKKTDSDLLDYSYTLRPITSKTDTAALSKAAQTIYQNVELPQLDELRVDGMKVEDFTPDKFSYDYTLPAFYPKDTIPQVSAKAADGLDIQVTQPTEAPTVDKPVTATVTVTKGEAKVSYTISIVAQADPEPVQRLGSLIEVPSDLNGGNSGKGVITVGDENAGRLLYAFTGYAGIYEDETQAKANPGGPIKAGDVEYKYGFAGNTLQIMDIDISGLDATSFSAVAGLDGFGDGRGVVKFSVWAYKNVADLTADYYRGMAPNKDSLDKGTVLTDGWTKLAETKQLSGKAIDDKTFANLSLTYEENGETKSYEAIRLVADPSNGSNGHDNVVWANPTITTGEQVESPEFRSISMDGATLPGFDLNKTEYTFGLGSGAAVPQITADYDDDMFVYVEQASAVPGTAIVKTADKTYTINFTTDENVPNQQQAGLSDYVTMPEFKVDGTNQTKLFCGNLIYASAQKGGLYQDKTAEGDKLAVGDKTYETGFTGAADQVMDIDVSNRSALRLQVDAGVVPATNRAAESDVTFEVYGAKDVHALNNKYYTDGAAEGVWTKLDDAVLASGTEALDIDLTYTENGAMKSYQVIRLVAKTADDSNPTVVWGDPQLTFLGDQLEDPWATSMRGSSLDSKTAKFDYLVYYEPTLIPGGQSFTHFLAVYDADNRMIGYEGAQLDAANNNADGDFTIALPDGSKPASAVYAQIADDGSLVPLSSPYRANSKGVYVTEARYGSLTASNPKVNATVDGGNVTVTGTGFAPAAQVVLKATVEGRETPDYLGIFTANGKGEFTFTYTSNVDPSKSNMTIEVGGQGVAKAASVKLENGVPAPEVQVTGIEIAAQPTKTAYTVGEDLDTTGLAVNKVMSDDSKVALAEGEYGVSGFDSTKAGEVTVTVTLKDDATKSATFKVTVAADKTALNTAIKDATATVKDESAYTAESWKAYAEALAAARAVVADPVATAENVTKAVEALNAAVAGLQPKPEEKPVIESIEIVAKPSKTAYQVGDKLDLAGLKVTAKMSDGTTVDLSAADYTVSGFDSSKPGAVTITVAYKLDDSKTATFDVTVKAKDDSGDDGKDDGNQGGSDNNQGGNTGDESQNQNNDGSDSVDNNGASSQNKGDGSKGELPQTGDSTGMVMLAAGAMAALSAGAFALARKSREA